MRVMVRKADNGYIVEGMPDRYTPTPPIRVAIEIPQVLRAVEEILAMPEPEPEDNDDF